MYFNASHCFAFHCFTVHCNEISAIFCSTLQQYRPPTLHRGEIDAFHCFVSQCIPVDCIMAPYSGSHCSGFTSGRVRGQVEGRGRWWSGLPTDPQSTLYITTTSLIRNPCYTIHWSTIQWIWPLELPTVYQTSFNIHWTIIYALNWTSQSKPFLKVDPQIKIHQGHPSFM